jgi:hypothetical protein
MAYRPFVPPHADTTSTPATVATTATVQGRAPQRERHTPCDNRDSCDTSNLIRPKCRKVATVADAQVDMHAAFEERAALIEYGAAVPRAWAEGFAQLNCASPITGFSAETWQRLINDGGAFLDRWGNEAAALGWTVTDVFGVDPTAPAARFDRMGLVPLINGGAVVAIDATSATLKTRTGGTLRYHLANVAGAVPLWEPMT